MGDIVGRIYFSSKEAEKTFKSFDTSVMREFQNDLLGLLKKWKPEIDKQDHKVGIIKATERIGDRHLIVEMVWDFNKKDCPVIIFNTLKDVDIDEYLDEMNKQKLSNPDFTHKSE